MLARTRIQLVVLALVVGGALAGCRGSAPASVTSGVETTAQIGRPASAPILVTSSAPTPVAVATLAAIVPELKAAVRGPQIVVVSETNGYGVWTRHEPAGRPLKVWPEGAPMQVIGGDRVSDNRRWLNVRTPDGDEGWVAADYVKTGDAAALADAIRNAPRPPSASSAPPNTAASAQGGPPSTQARAAAPPPTSARQTGAARPVLPTPAPAPARPAPTPAPPTPAAPTVPPRLAGRIDPRLMPAYLVLTGVDGVGGTYKEFFESSKVRITVGPLDGAWGQYASRTDIITVNASAITESPRALASVLAHELTHAVQSRGNQRDCVSGEVEAFLNQTVVWHDLWGDNPPHGTRLELQLSDLLHLYADQGEAGVRARVRNLYQQQCQLG